LQYNRPGRSLGLERGLLIEQTLKAGYEVKGRFQPASAVPFARPPARW